MVCPVCKNTMIVVEHNRIELDYCPHCRGVWFDSGELELWLKSMGREDSEQFFGNILKTPEGESAEKERKCPVCHQRMRKVNIGQPPILIDVCRRGNGIWFDGGEVGRLLKQLKGGPPAGEPEAQPGVAAFLADVFQAEK